MRPGLINRRTLLQLGAGLGIASLGSLALPALAQQAGEQRRHGKFASLTPELAATLEAMAARILPTTDTPGARELGVIWFMDTALGGDVADAQPLVDQGVAALDTAAGGAFSAQNETRQDVLLQHIDQTPFFGVVRFLTLAGAFCMPKYGGNKDEAGWDLLGFERGHHWTPPFGYYDRDAYGETTTVTGESS